MAFLEALPLIADLAEGGAAAGEAGAGAGAAETAGATSASEGGGVTSDFNDTPTANTVGSSFGRKVVDNLAAHQVAHGIEGAGGGGQQGGGGPATGGANIGSWAGAT